MDINEGLRLEPWFPKVALQFFIGLNAECGDDWSRSWPSYCCAILQDTQTGAFLFEKRPESASVAPDALTCFGGKRDPRESPDACLLRELREELGWDAGAASRGPRGTASWLPGSTEAPPRDVELSFGERHTVWWEARTSSLKKISPWHRCVLEAFKEGRSRADYPTCQ